MAFLDRQPRSADAVAVTDTWVYVLSRQKLEALERTDAALWGHLFEHVALEISQRLRIANTELRALEDR